MELRTFFDFCAGIGGGRLGLEQCGLTSVGYSETSRLSDISYRLMHDTQHERNFGNLKNIHAGQLPPYDVLIAGFPCQTFSVIGRQKGFNDDRGQIIFHLARHLSECQPKCFILENVRGLVTHDNGKTIKIIMKQLQNCGYIVSYRVLSSVEYGVPQMRQRVYFIGIREDLNIDVTKFQWPQVVERPPLADYLISENNEITPENLDYFRRYLNNPTNQGRYTLERFLEEEYLVIDTRMSDLRLYRGRVPTLRSHRDGIFYIKNHSIRQLTGYEALLLQGFPKECAGSVKDTVTDRHLLMQAGNAMTVNVIHALGSSLVNLFQSFESIHKKNLIEGANTMAKSWQEFELYATNYLSQQYGETASFTHCGDADSTVPDIKVSKKDGSTFFIEAKLSPAQCGQFVLLPDIPAGTFRYSPRNPTPQTQNTDIIIAHMNSYFTDYQDAGTGGVAIQFDGCGQIFNSWIIEYYRQKGVMFFITNDCIIFPIEQFATYFDVSAVYRIKRSGSSNVGNRNMPAVMGYIKAMYDDVSCRNHGGKLFVTSSQNLVGSKFELGKYEYMFSLRDSEYEIRKLANTYNANVIFSIRLKSSQVTSDLVSFQHFLAN